MADGTDVDLEQLRAAAERVAQIADQTVETCIPTIELADHLPGSRVATLDVPARIAARVDGLTEALHLWVTAVSSAADAFERADERSAVRFPR